MFENISDSDQTTAICCNNSEVKKCANLCSIVPEPIIHGDCAITDPLLTSVAVTRPCETSSSSEEILSQRQILHDSTYAEKLSVSEELSDTVSSPDTNFVESNSPTHSNSHDPFEPIDHSCTDVIDGNSCSACSKSNTLKDQLTQWYVNNYVSQKCFKELLSVLKPLHPDLPADPRTFFKHRDFHIKDVQHGQFVYFGLASGIPNNINFDLTGIDTLKLDINCDGIPIYRSKNSAFWPILCSVSNSVPFKPNSILPFVVALFYGSKKPDVTEYLLDFCRELENLSQPGLLIDGARYNVKIRAIIADAPARAFIKQIKGHSAYYSCDRCEVRGTYRNSSISLDDLNAPKRTHLSFISQSQKEHHNGISPFVTVGINMIESFPLDYMHLILLGIVRRILGYWVNKISFKLSVTEKHVVNDKIEDFRKFVPNDFNRLPRKLDEADKFKATEFRTLLLYLGVIVFKGVLKTKYMNNFLILMTIVRILCNKNLIHDEEILQYVENLCKTFIRQYQKLYKCNVVYNIHSLIHIVDDVRKFGVLDSISAFPYESMLGNIKRKLRSGHLPLAQICHRISEGQFCYNKKQQQKENIMIINGSVIKPKILKNSCVLLRNKSIALVNKVEGSLLNVSIFKNKRPAFSYPCSSEISEMFIVDKNLEASSIILSDIEKVSYLPWEKLLCFCSSPLIVNFLSSSLQIFFKHNVQCGYFP